MKWPEPWMEAAARRQQEAEDSSCPRSWTDDTGQIHYALDHARGGALGPASWTSEHDVNPICGCHLASRCLGCNCCTNCEGCYCGEE